MEGRDGICDVPENRWDLEKYYDLSIQMDKKEIAKVALTGKFRISDGLDYALRVLQNDVAFTYQRNRDNDVIHIK